MKNHIKKWAISLLAVLVVAMVVLPAPQPAYSGFFSKGLPVGAAVSTFLELLDVPSSFSGSAGKLLMVDSTPDAIEFVTLTDVARAQYSNTVTVMASGGDYTKLSDALAARIDATATNRCLIEVFGRIADTTVITAKSYVDVIGYEADVVVTSTAGLPTDGVCFDDVVECTWRDITIRRQGALSQVRCAMFKGTTDETCRIYNCRFLNETAAAVDYCFGILFDEECSPYCDVYGKGSDGGDGCSGIVFEDAAHPSGVFHGKGGDGGADCVGIGFSGASAPTGVFYARGGSGGGTCFHFQILDGAAPVGQFISELNQYNDMWSYSAANNGRFRPFADKPYMLTSVAVYVSSTTPGRTLDLGTQAAGNEIADDIDVGTTGYKSFDFTRAEIAANAYMYATPSDTMSFSVVYTVVSNQTSCTGIYIRTVGFASISNSCIVTNGVSHVVYIHADALTTMNWKITNSHLESLDPTNQKSVYAAAGTEDIPVYNSVLVGGQTNVTSFAAGTARQTNTEI